MPTANKLIARGSGLAAALIRRAPSVALDWDVRQKSRFEATDSSGRPIAVFLPRGGVVRGGDILVCDDGSMVRVEALPQPLLVVTHCTDQGTPFDLLRAAYHLGNRHVPLALQADRLHLEPDHVLASMLRQMHLIVREAVAPFEPENGAYAAGGHVHSHDHGHGHNHDSDPDREHPREPAPHVDAYNDAHDDHGRLNADPRSTAR
jgi:urease accessory protein